MMQKIKKTVSKVINPVLTELGNSDYQIKTDSQVTKGTIEIKMPNYGDLELELAKDSQKSLKANHISYTPLGSNQVLHLYQKQPPVQAPQRKQPTAPSSIPNYVKQLLRKQVLYAEYSLTNNQTPSTGKTLEIKTPGVGIVELVLDSTAQNIFRAKEIAYTDPLTGYRSVKKFK